MIRRLLVACVLLLGVAAGVAWFLHEPAAVGLSADRSQPEPEPSNLLAELVREQPETWVDLFMAERSWGDYTLVLYQRRLPMVIDMAGRPVHAWPQVAAVGRARLTPQGHLLAITADDSIVEYDWDGAVVWSYRLPEAEDLPHHDLIRLADGNVLILARDFGDGTDYLVEVDGSGQVVWSWSIRDHLDREFPSWDRESTDPTHLNSIRELPANDWYEAGDQRFRPGNILVSARHLDSIFIIDKASGELVWRYDHGLDYQHEASMIERGTPGAGNILLFNNGYRNRFAYRQSAVLELDPVAAEVVWSYRSPGFFSSTGGTAQKLPNGNVLVTSSDGGRVFEIEPGGRIVWQWAPPFHPMRALRYRFDHCPQLLALGRPEVAAMAPRRRRFYLDRDLYAFALADEYHQRDLYGRKRRILNDGVSCRRILVPPQAHVVARYGLDPAAGEGTATFTMTLRPVDGEEAKELLRDPVSAASDPPWRSRRLRIGRFRGRWAELCVAVEGADGGAPAWALWENPLVVSEVLETAYKSRRPPPLPQRDGAEEQELERRQLEALGYVN